MLTLLFITSPLPFHEIRNNKGVKSHLIGLLFMLILTLNPSAAGYETRWALWRRSWELCTLHHQQIKLNISKWRTPASRHHGQVRLSRERLFNFKQPWQFLHSYWLLSPRPPPTTPCSEPTTAASSRWFLPLLFTPLPLCPYHSTIWILFYFIFFVVLFCRLEWEKRDLYEHACATERAKWITRDRGLPELVNFGGYRAGCPALELRHARVFKRRDSEERENWCDGFRGEQLYACQKDVGQEEILISTAVWGA